MHIAGVSLWRTERLILGIFPVLKSCDFLAGSQNRPRLFVVRYHGWPMDALHERMESDLEVIMVGTWMLCGNGWSLIWTLSWLAVDAL